MVHESISREDKSNKTIAIIGAGPAGCICAKFLQDAGFDITFFDKGKFLRTILPTGGGRCNLAHAEYDFRELAKNYPRGEKFLYSIFSRFGTSDTIEFFNSIGIQTYTQADNRIFPVSNSAKDVRSKLLSSIKKAQYKKERVFRIEKLNNGYKLISEKSTYFFDIIIVAIGGHAGFELLSSNLGINIIEPTQALVGLTTEEDLSMLSGVKVPNVTVKVGKKTFCGDIMFTHQGVTGPVIYTISSVFARSEFPFEIELKFADFSGMPEYFLEKSASLPSNRLKPFVPKSITNYILKTLNLQDGSLGRASQKRLLNALESYTLHITGKMPKGEVVTCGGVDLKAVNSKTLESKQYSGMYFCGEVLDIDGFCGGFNLQNCWSTGYVVSQAIINSK